MQVIYPDLENKAILLTGATRGIGNAIAKSLAIQKAKIIFNYRSNEEAAKELAAQLKELGASEVHYLKFDVTDTAQMKESVDAYLKEHGQIQGLINNAGISRDQLIMRMKEEDLTAVLDTNLKSAMMLTSILSKNFLRAEDVSVVNVSSVVGLMGNISQSAYAASKAGLLGFSKSLAKELASRNVRCNAICPGFIDTEMTQALAEKAKETYIENIPLSRFGTTDEISNLVNFLLSNASGYITGEIIKIDGGLYI
jgi:3-oxoacyl-[acyl-carrier protein] reductase